LINRNDYLHHVKNKRRPDPSIRIPYSETIAGGKLDVKEVIQPIYDEINKKYGINEKQEE